MIDGDDVDDWWLLSMMTNGWVGFVCFIIFIIVVIVKCGNDGECAEMHCDKGTPRLLDHGCRCIEDAVKK